MGRGEYLGEFEQIVLATLVRLGEEAYGVSVRQEIEARTGREVTIGAVYATLERLEQKGYIGSWIGEPTPERGGKAKRHFRVEPEGALALKRCRQLFAKVWEGLEPEVDRLAP